jgi:L-lactate dehydrogenase complex protein LldG
LFTARASAEKVGATVERIGSLADYPAAVARYAQANGLPPSLALQPDPRLQRLAWAPLDTSETLTPNTLLSVGFARGGIAETGTLIFHSGPESPILSSYLSLHHVVALDARAIVAQLEDYAAAEKFGAAPHNVNLITGASGTTDIEGVLARGAHGPRKLHIVIFDSVF